MLQSLRRLAAAAVAAAGLLLLPAAGVLAQEAAPAEPVKSVDSALLEAMKKADELGFSGRYELLAPVLDRTFDFDYMAEIALGRHWPTLDEPQKQQVIQRFRDMSIATFAARFDGYSGEKFQLGDTRDGPRGSKLVSNRLIKGDGEAIPINFLLRESEGEWRIVDVLLNAKFSELATKRSEYTSVVDSQGVDRLIQLLDQKLAQLRSE